MFHGVSSTNRENRSLEKKIRVLCSRRERTEFTRRPNVKASVINFGRSTKEPAAVSASRFALKILSRIGDKHIGYKVGQLLTEIQEYLVRAVVGYTGCLSYWHPMSSFDQAIYKTSKNNGNSLVSQGERILRGILVFWIHSLFQFCLTSSRIDRSKFIYWPLFCISGATNGEVRKTNELKIFQPKDRIIKYLIAVKPAVTEYFIRMFYYTITNGKNEESCRILDVLVCRSDYYIWNSPLSYSEYYLL